MLDIYKGVSVKEKEATDVSATTPQAVYEHLKDTAKLSQEAFTLITINSRNKIIDTHMVHLGSINSSLVSAREVFRIALKDNAVAIIVSHNHPSGETSPSSEDIKVTKQLIEGGKILGLKVLDHVIIGEGRNPYLSLRECGLCTF